MEEIERSYSIFLEAVRVAKLKLNTEKEELLLQKKLFEEEKEKWYAVEKALSVSQVDNKIKLDIGGKQFTSSKATLSNGKSGFFSGMFSGRWSIQKDEDGSIFIDRDPTAFPFILNYLRGESVDFWSLSQFELSRLKLDAEFYQVGLVFPNTFNPDLCGPKTELLNFNKTARNTASGHSSVVSLEGVETGQVVWKVRADHFSNPSHWIAVGVTQRTQLNRTNDFSDTYSLSSKNQKYGVTTGSSSLASGDWKDGDIIQVELNVDSKTLVVKNTRTGKGENWILPSAGGPEKWHLYVNLYNNGDQVTIIEH